MGVVTSVYLMGPFPVSRMVEIRDWDFGRGLVLIRLKSLQKAQYRHQTVQSRHQVMF